MAVTKSGWKLSDGRQVVHVRKSRQSVRGSDRKGIRASDLMKALTDPVEAMKTSPMTEKPRVLIETMRVVGDDVMTAHDTAIYERLLAHARDEGIDQESHQIAVGALMKYLDVRNVDRVVESLERITRTVVRYDFQDDEVRRRGAMPLIIAEVAEDLRSGTATLTYAIPGPIRRVVLAARDYAWLEINAFAQFKSRYAGRLYQRLALRAGYDEPLRKPWEIAPLQLAEELGYPLEKDGTLHYASFIRRCLEPAMKDIEECVTRFSVGWEVGRRGEGRGRPVETLVLKVSGLRKRFEENRAARLSRQGLAASRASDPDHPDSDIPGMLFIGKAMTLTGRDEFTLIREWKAALKEARANPGGHIAGIAMQGGFLLSVLKKEGVAAAFGMWSEMLPAAEKSPSVVRSAPLPRPPVKQPALQPTAATDRKPIVLVDTPTYKSTVYPAYPKPASRPPVIVDDPFDYVDNRLRESRPDVDEECPF
jgi:hypothetical protein